MQSKADSFIEASINIAIGFLLSCVVMQITSWVYHLHTNVVENISMVCIFTVTSFLRQYFLRRWFNGRLIWQRLKDAVPANPAVPAKE